MTAYNKEAMRARLRAAISEKEVLEKKFEPLHAAYEAARKKEFEVKALSRRLGTELVEAEAPLRELSREIALLAKAVGTVTLVNDGVQG